MDPARADGQRRRAEMFERWATQEGPLERSKQVVDSYTADMKRALEFEANPANCEALQGLKDRMAAEAAR
jgi:hypothetical protein